MRLFADLGLDSLDIADLISSIDREVLHATISLFDQVTVGELMAMAAGHVLEQGGAPSPIKLKKKWFEQCKRPPPIFAKGETFQEVFLRSCARMNSYVACADAVAGIMTYSAVKMRVLLLAAHIRKLPSPHVGIMLPSSTAAQILIFATLMAKKIPVMINWTLGARYLEAVKKILNIDSILSSKAFLDRLENADVAPIDPLIKTLEMLRFEISIWDKIKAFCQSRLPVHTILKQCKVDKVSPDDIAVILFTSGTEALPKAVPLSHANLLSNQKEAAASISVGPGDIMMSFLPPFHSLGFSITGLVPLNMGMKVVYSPNPNDSLRLGREIEQYGTTIVCSAPTFLKNIFHVTQPEQLRSVRMFICGAEAVSKELFDKVHQLGNDAVLLEGYGITECGPILTVNRSHKPCKGVGLPMPGVELCIVHPDTHELLSTGSTGLILARSPGIFRGYLGDVKSPFIQVNGKNWYSTGDLGHLDKDGYLILEGRLKRFVKMGGEMISLPAVEAALLEAFKNKSEAPALAVIASLQSNDRPTLSLFANFVVEVDEANQALKQMGFSNLVKINDSHFLKTMPLTGAGKNDYLYLQTLVKQ
jgi:long-chain-fatty-acid--[acyl-carrier-protein] ligase